MLFIGRDRVCYHGNSKEEGERVCCTLTMCCSRQGRSTKDPRMDEHQLHQCKLRGGGGGGEGEGRGRGGGGGGGGEGRGRGMYGCVYTENHRG